MREHAAKDEQEEDIYATHGSSDETHGTFNEEVCVTGTRLTPSHHYSYDCRYSFWERFAYWFARGKAPFHVIFLS